MKNERIDKIMESLDGMDRVEAPYFFTSKLLARLKVQPEMPQRIFFLRPAFVVAALAIMMLVNVILLTKTSNVQVNNVQQEATIESFAEAYHLTTNSY